MRDPFHIGISLRFHKTWRASNLLIHANVVSKHSLTSTVSLYYAFGLHTVSFRMTFSFIIPSACGAPHNFIPPSVIKQRLTAQKIPSHIHRRPILLDHSLLSLSVAPYSISPSLFILTGYGVHVFVNCVIFKEAGKFLHGSPRAAVHLMLWTGGMFLLALLMTRASLCLPSPSIPYISSTSFLIFPYFILADL